MKTSEKKCICAMICPVTLSVTFLVKILKSSITYKMYWAGRQVTIDFSHWKQGFKNYVHARERAPKINCDVSFTKFL